MSDESWAKRLKEAVNDLIDRVYSYFMVDDGCEYVSTGKYDPVNIEIRLSIKIRRK